MKLIETHYLYEDGGKGSVNVALYDDEGKRIKGVTIRAGEPEDAVFFRDLDGAFNIVGLAQTAYEAGKRGEPLEYEFIDESEGE
ncbi:hypothetical protein M5X04_26865 [Paenibacillus alvei]|uniref:Uncharacterized protein n=1 Tax=Paenibacillus alvei TaxID=44250 RepID=A0ABT4EGR7_PAEAL|nr:hypothetical protein [Paenibacillus alvei]MCY9532935.1 hypothetical protein [Paenibacillus alvei]